VTVSLMKIKSILISVLVLVSTGANAEVLHVSDHGFIVKNQIHTNSSVADAWRAMVEDVDSWWPKDHTWWGEDSALSIDPRAGGCFCETSDTNSAEHMRISFVEVGKLLRMTGGLGPLQGMGMHGALDWQFKATDIGTQITLTYKVSGINPEGFVKLAPIVGYVQGVQLGGLKVFLEKD
jgi:hypothetical protein